MLDWMFIVVFLIALILFLLIILYEDEIQVQWILGLIIFDIVLWWSLASGNLEIEKPYVINNATSGQVETGYYIFSSKTSPALMYIFSAPAVLMFIYMNYTIYITIRNAWRKMKGG